MKGIFVILALVALAVAHDQEWETYKAEFGKKYSPKEEITRYKIFKDNKKVVEEHNKKFEEGKVTFTMGLNKFADMTVEETSFLRGYKHKAGDLKVEGEVYEAPKDFKVGAADVDWRTKGYVTGVKDQGQCGSCWAFSTTGSMEGQHYASAGKLVSLSEQNLLDCVSGDTCNGGLMTDAFQYIITNGGIDTEASYPYEEVMRTCRYTKANSGATCKNYKSLARSEDALLSASTSIGPISVAIDASHLSFQLYTSGVYYESACSSLVLDHGVLVVGYGTESLEDYWLVKNSWGTSWGEKGYINMARNRDNNCGIASEASYPIV